MKLKAARRLRRLPRAAYWVAGAILACTGALGARLISELFPLGQRIPIWLTGAGIVFLGLCVLSLGTRAWLETSTEEKTTASPPADVAPQDDQVMALPDPNGPPQPSGAGEGNRTLV